MAAISTLAAVAGGALLSALTRKKSAGPAPTAPTLPAAPDPAVLAAQRQEAAQRAASFARLRSSVNPAGTPGGVGGTQLTGPAGIPSPAPIARKGLLGQ